MKGSCDICNTEIEIQMCCSGHECGCMGMPVDPPVCSDKCYDIFIEKLKNQSNQLTPFKQRTQTFK